MTKTIKMSLVAVVAVAGIASSAVAVDYKGQLYVEKHASTTGDASTVNGYDIDIDVTATAKINDNFSGVVTVEADSENNEDELTKPGFTAKQAYIAYSGNGLGVMFGRQGISTPTTDGETGEGILATYTMAGITVAGGHFETNAISTTTGLAENATALAVLGAAGPVNFQLWQVNANTNENTTVALSGKFGPVSAGLRHAMTTPETGKDGDTTIVTLGTKAGKAEISFTYLMNGKDKAAFTTSSASANTVEMVKLHAKNTADVSAMILDVSMPFANGYSAAVKYGTADVGDTLDMKEMVLQLDKKIAKNLNASLRYSMLNGLDVAAKAADDARYAEEVTTMRADIKYSF